MTSHVRLAARALLRTPGFTIGAILPLALGFALTAATAAVLNAYLIRPLPYPFADRVYHVRYAPPGPWEPAGLSGLDWKSLSDVVEFPMASAADAFYVSGGGTAPPLRGRRVTFGLLAGLTAPMAAGRWLIASDFQGGSEPAALIGFNVWRDRFGSDPNVVGKPLATETENGRAERFRIAGVLPRDFYVGGDSQQPIEMIVPFDTSARRYYMVRLRPGVSPGVAERRITETARQIATDLPADWTGAQLELAHDRYAGQFRPVLLGVTVAASLLLVIVFANVAVLIVLRTTRRQKEIALRLALGSTRGQLVRWLAAEAGLVAAGAAVAGVLLTQLGLGIARPLIETQLGRSAPGGTATIAVDGTVLVAIGAAGLAGALALTFLPLGLLRGGRLAHALRRAGTTVTDGLAMRKLRSSVLAAEVAATLVLLVGCGLLLRSVVTMVRTDLGFESSRLARSRVALRAVDYADAPAFSRFFDQFVSRAAAAGAPLVFSSWPPFAEFPEHAIEIDGRSGMVLNAGAVNVGPGYFGTLGVTLRAGRDITADDVAASAPVAVVSESLARRLWPDGAALGKQIRQVAVTARGPQPPGPWQIVVGVVADVRQKYADPNVADIYSPWIPNGRFGSFYVRADRPLPALSTALRDAATAIDPHAVVNPVRAVDEENRELAGTTFLTTMLGAFAGIAGVIAVLGVYAVTAYAVQQREREVAIRMALGAGRGAVARLFLRESTAVLAVGLAVGLAGAAVAARMLEHEVFAVRRFDVATMAGMCALMAGACVAATWWPARRASQKNPAVSLKEV